MSFASFDDIYWICCEMSRHIEESFPSFDHPMMADHGMSGMMVRSLRISRKIKSRPVGVVPYLAAKDTQVIL